MDFRVARRVYRLYQAGTGRSTLTSEIGVCYLATRLGCVTETYEWKICVSEKWGGDEAERQVSRVRQIHDVDIEVLRSVAEALCQANHASDASYAILLDRYISIRTGLAVIDSPDQGTSRAKGEGRGYLNKARVITTYVLIGVLAIVAGLGLLLPGGSAAAAPYVSLLSGLTGIALGWLFRGSESPNGTGVAGKRVSQKII